MGKDARILLQKTVKGHLITLRAPDVSDATYLADYWFGPASAHLLPYTDTTAFPTREDYLTRMQALLAGCNHEGPWFCLVGDVAGKPSGNVMINELVPEEEALVHVHIWDPTLRRTGIASELASDVFTYFFNAFNLKRLILQVPTENAPVIRLLESLGLKSEGTFFGRAAPVCKEGPYARFVITRSNV